MGQPVTKPCHLSISPLEIHCNAKHFSTPVNPDEFGVGSLAEASCCSRPYQQNHWLARAGLNWSHFPCTTTDMTHLSDIQYTDRWEWAHLSHRLRCDVINVNGQSLWLDRERERERDRQRDKDTSRVREWDGLCVFVELNSSHTSAGSLIKGDIRHDIISKSWHL